MSEPFLIYLCNNEGHFNPFTSDLAIKHTIEGLWDMLALIRYKNS